MSAVDTLWLMELSKIVCMADCMGRFARNLDPMPDEYRKPQARLVAEHISKLCKRFLSDSPGPADKHRMTVQLLTDCLAVAKGEMTLQ